MASICISERNIDDLPQVCMQCGQPAHNIVQKTFSWYPVWIWFTILFYVLPYFFFKSIFTKRMIVPAPFCDQHKNHWNHWWNTIQPTEITDKWITLKNVAPEFAQAYEDRMERSRETCRYRDDYEDEPDKPRRRRDDDAFEDRSRR